MFTITFCKNPYILICIRGESKTPPPTESDSVYEIQRSQLNLTIVTLAPYSAVSSAVDLRTRSLIF